MIKIKMIIRALAAVDPIGAISGCKIKIKMMIMPHHRGARPLHDSPWLVPLPAPGHVTCCSGFYRGSVRGSA
jgi:hypothetical protein